MTDKQIINLFNKAYKELVEYNFMGSREFKKYFKRVIDMSRKTKRVEPI